ncbi:AAA family ATPase [Subtercola sp. YIM 133946]|uniref:AAA family ATPase n=1 Tax=Subtercola sp. YIM 133946 TaxID=3118909 RepID=UPI002F939737
MIIEGLRVADERADRGRWPYTVPAVAGLIGEGLRLEAPVTFLVGENGSGKSTIVEAIAEAWGVDVRGGHSGRKYSSELARSPLGEILVLDRGAEGVAMVRTKAKGFFLRSETAFDVFERLGYGPGYTEVSHGESFLQTFEERFGGRGLYILDEPEAALSFTACLSLIAKLAEVVEAGGQVICATHSPILTAMHGASIVELDADGLRPSAWAELELVQHWRRFLDAPERYLRHL